MMQGLGIIEHCAKFLCNLKLALNVLDHIFQVINLQALQQGIGWSFRGIVATEAELEFMHNPVCNNNQIYQVTYHGINRDLLSFLRVRLVMPSHYALDRSRKSPVVADQISEVIVTGALVDEFRLKEVYVLVQCKLRIREELVVIIVFIQLESSNLSDIVHKPASIGSLVPRLTQILGNRARRGGNTYAMFPHPFQREFLFSQFLPGKDLEDRGRKYDILDLVESEHPDGIVRISDFTNVVAAAGEQQNATINEISNNLSGAATASNEIAKNIQMVATNAEDTSTGATESQGEAEKLNVMAAELAQLLGQFRY